MKRLAMWSGPRNISTAMMRSWENRPDTVVVDEPLYAHYLAQTGLDHPGRDEILAAGPTDWTDAVAAVMSEAPAGVEIFYQKHMTHHLLPHRPTDWIARLHNVLLIRDPSEVVASYVRSRADVTAADIGLAQQVTLYDELTGAGHPAPVIDSADFLRQPEAYLRWLCADLGVSFTDAMLRWPAGPRASDGVWARHWYAAVVASTGFERYRSRDVDLSGPALAAARASQPYYDRLRSERIVL